MNSSERGDASRGACAAAGIHNRGVLLVPDCPDDNARDGGARRQPPLQPLICDHGRDLNRELCEQCAADDAELDAL